MSDTPEAIAERLARLGANPRSAMVDLFALLRADGMHSGDREFRLGIQLYRSVKTTDAAEWVSRSEAARLLGVSVKRVDQLRAQKRLDAQRIASLNQVRVCRKSLDRMLDERAGTTDSERRAMGQLRRRRRIA